MLDNNNIILTYFPPQVAMLSVEHFVIDDIDNDIITVSDIIIKGGE